MPLNRFRQMSTATVLRRVWPEVAILRALYAEGILSYNWDPTEPGRPGRRRDQLFCCSPARLPTHLANPARLEQYLQSLPGAGQIPGQVTYVITNSRSPHGARQLSRFACLWEVAWEGGDTVEHFAFWSPSNAPVSAVAYATVTLCSKSWLKLWASGACAHSACCPWLCQWPAEGVGVQSISQGPSLATEEDVHSSYMHSVCCVPHFHSRGVGHVGRGRKRLGMEWV